MGFIQNIQTFDCLLHFYPRIHCLKDSHIEIDIILIFEQCIEKLFANEPLPDYLKVYYK